MLKRFSILVVLLALIGGVFYFTRDDKAADAAKKPDNPPVPVTVVTAAAKDTPLYVSGIGNVTALNQVVVRSRIDGELVQVRFTEGQTVRQGDLLALIDDRAIRADLARAQADKASSQARLVNAQLNLKRYNSLLQDDAIARQTVDQETANVRQLQAAVDIAQAAINATEVQLSFTRITAPLSGYAGIRNVDAGNVVRAADANGLVTITQVTPIAVLFSLPQTTLNDILPLMAQSDRPVEIFATGNDAREEDKQGDGKQGEVKGDGKRLAAGQLQAIDNQIDPTTGTVRVKAVSPNDPQTLWPGQFVMVRVRTGVLKDKIVLPLTALQRRNNDPKGDQGNAVTVYRVTNGNKAEQVPVTVLHEDRDSAVLDGIAAGDRIVVDGQSRLKTDSILKIDAPQDTPPAEPTGDLSGDPSDGKAKPAPDAG